MARQIKADCSKDGAIIPLVLNSSSFTFEISFERCNICKETRFDNQIS